MRKLSDISSYKGTESIMKVPPSGPRLTLFISQRLHSNTITSELGLQYENFGGHKNSIYSTFLFPSFLPSIILFH